MYLNTTFFALFSKDFQETINRCPIPYSQSSSWPIVSILADCSIATLEESTMDTF